jgi:hypothetical protein
LQQHDNNLAIEHGAILVNGKIQRYRLEIEGVAKSKGLLAAIVFVTNRIRRRVANKVRLYFWYNYNRLLKSRAMFLFQGDKYHYFFNSYNMTWRNERAVEIPIVKRILQETKGDVLEVGNVLSHYFDVKYDIVDKYERAKGVIHQDVTEIQTSKRYDLIISISTLEHVGWDENPDHSAFIDDPEKILKALTKLRSLLKRHGKIVITVPLGYNPHLDDLLKNGKLKVDQMFFMKRGSRGDKWIQATWNEVKTVGFNIKVPTANAILIGIVENCS